MENRTLTLTNLEKVLYPSGFTKAQVVDYYARAADWILPHLKDRPVTLKRLPDGVEGKVFYTKDAPRYTPDWVSIAPVPRRNGGPDIRYIVIDSQATLVWCANLASLEIHPFLHCRKALGRPSSIVFDLDPGEGTSLITTAAVAVLLRDELARMGLQTCVKLSGSKGIQVYVPLNTAATYERTRPFAKAVAESLEQAHPELIVSAMAKTLRPGKIFIDWSQNSDFKTTVGVYSLRAKSEKPFVSLPLAWDEIDEVIAKRATARFCLTPEAALKRLAKVGDLFGPLLTLRQKLPPPPPPLK